MTILISGVRDVELSLGDEVVWSGEVKRGCGNQVFDYSTTIILGEEKRENNQNVQT